MRLRVVLSALGAGLALALPSVATASTNAFQIGSVTIPSNTIELPSVVVDSNGTAYAAWADSSNQQIDWCILPTGATSCAESGALSPVNEPGGDYGSPPSAPRLISGPSLTIDDGVVSLIAQADGPDDSALNGTPIETEEWQTPVGGTSFTLVNGGNSVAWPDPSPSQDASYLQDAVVVPGTDELGEFDFTPDGPPSFEAYPLTDPPSCSENTNPECAFATLEPASNPDPVSNQGTGVTRQIVSSTGSNAGILAYRETDDSTGPFACDTTVEGQPFNIGDVYMWGSGVQSATNNYNISPGQPDSAWKVAATQIPNDCPAHEIALGGGPGGFGMLESSEFGSVSSMSYVPFDTATGAFDEPAVPVDPNADAQSENLTQDGVGNLYATALIYSTNGGGTGGDEPVGMYYSGDGGKTWEGPAPLESTLQPQFSRQATAVNAGGQGWMIISSSSGQIYALPFNAAEASAQFAASLQSPPAVSDNTVTVGLSCAQVPCTVTTNLTSAAQTGSRVGHSGATALGTATVTISQSGVQDVQIPLTSAGVSALQSSGGSLSATLAESTAVGAYAQQTSTPVTLTDTQTGSGTNPASGSGSATPVLTRLTLSSRVLTTRLIIGYRVSVAGTMKVTVDARRAHGRLLKVDAFTHRDRAGVNTLTFTGRIGSHRLPPGAYEFKLVPTAHGHIGTTTTVPFTVLRLRAG